MSGASSDDEERVRVLEGWPLSLAANGPLGDWEKYTKVRMVVAWPMVSVTDCVSSYSTGSGL